MMFIFALITLTLSINLSSAVAVNQYEIVRKNYTMTLDIHRQKSPYEQYVNHGHRLGDEFDFFKKGGNRDNDSIALYRWLDNEFYGTIVIGHPGQTLYVAFDTSWSLSWVISDKCSSIKTIGCYFHRKYNHDKSSEYKKDGTPFFMDAGSFNMSGFFSYDNISIAHSNVTAQRFIEMEVVPWNLIFERADGVLGLGLKTDAYNPFFYNLLEQKKIKNPLFSIYLNRDRQSNRGGNVMLGFIEPRHIHKNVVKNKTVPENITYLGVDNLPYWQFNMDKVIVDIPLKEPVILCEKGCKAIVDTNSNIIYGPKQDIDAIHDAIKAREFFLHRYTVDCDTVNKLPKINFVLSGKNFTLGGPDYIVKMSYRSITVCLSAFTPANTIQEQGRWDLGGVFLAQYYSIYDVQNKKIGFVKAA